MPRLFADTAPLKVAPFRWLWLTSIITIIGGHLTVVAVPAQIFALTGSSGYVGLTGLFGLIPLLIFGLYGGSIADAFDKRTVLMVTTSGLTLSTVLFWGLSAAGNTNVWLLLGAYSVQQAFFAVNQPTRTAIFPRILPMDELPAAISLNMTVLHLGAIMGPLLAGALLPFTGFTWLYAINTVALIPTFVAVFVLPPIPPNAKAQKAGLASVINGLKYVATQPILLASFAVDLTAMVFGMPRALYPEIATEVFHSPFMLSLLYASLAIGGALGGIFSGWVSRWQRQGAAVYMCVIIWGIAVTVSGLGVVGKVAWIVIGALIIGGMADMFSSAFRNAIMQQSASDEVQGRVQGAYMVIVLGGPRLADMAHGALSEYIGPGWTTLGGGILVVIGALVCLALLPGLWHYRKPSVAR
ncbi:MFS transporter [Corynebacterium pyruviciproducens]